MLNTIPAHIILLPMYRKASKGYISRCIFFPIAINHVVVRPFLAVPVLRLQILSSSIVRRLLLSPA